MKKIVLMFISALMASAVNAYDARIDGIYYNLVPKAKIAEVVAGEEKYSGHVVIPSTVEYEGITYNVSSVNAAFKECPELTSVAFPKGIKEIKPDTFKECLNLETVSLPEDLQTLGERAFYFCFNLKECRLPESVDSVGIYVFQECHSLTSTNIPEK